MASTIKDYSGIKEAVALYEQCATHVPENASYALNTMHLYELDLDYSAAIAALARHCEANPTATVGTLSLAELLAIVPSASSVHTSLWHAPSAEALEHAKANPVERALPQLPVETGAESPNPDKCKPPGTYNEQELDVPEKTLTKLQEELRERVARYYSKFEANLP